MLYFEVYFVGYNLTCGWFVELVELSFCFRVEKKSFGHALRYQGSFLKRGSSSEKKWVKLF